MAPNDEELSGVRKEIVRQLLVRKIDTPIQTRVGPERPNAAVVCARTGDHSMATAAGGLLESLAKENQNGRRKHPESND